jgi:hypothetical protein
LRPFRTLKAAIVAIALLAPSIPILFTATPALACIVDADGDCYRSVQGTVDPSNGLNVRTQPWGSILDTLPYNYTNTVSCYVLNTSDNSYWDWIYDSRIGRFGWVYDPYLYTGGNIYDQVDEMTEGNCAYFSLAAPTSVTATAISNSAIRVTWNDLTGGHAQYVVSNGNVSSATLAAGTTSYTWTGLSPNQYMCFTIAAKLGGNQSAWSPYGCTTTLDYNTPKNWIASKSSDGSSPSDAINLVMTANSTRSITDLLNALGALAASQYGPWQDVGICGNTVWANISGSWISNSYEWRQGGCSSTFSSGMDHFRVWSSGSTYYFSASTEQTCFPSVHCATSFNAGRDTLESDIVEAARASGWSISATFVSAYPGGTISTAIGSAPYDGNIDVFTLT